MKKNIKIHLFIVTSGFILIGCFLLFIVINTKRADYTDCDKIVEAVQIGNSKDDVRKILSGSHWKEEGKNKFVTICIPELNNSFLPLQPVMGMMIEINFDENDRVVSVKKGDCIGFKKRK